MPFRIIDIETTGFDPHRGAKIVEIASIDVDREGRIVGRQAHLVDPGIPIPPETSEVHHIIDADVKGKPPIDDVIGMYQGANIIYVAHNSEFERKFLHQLLGEPQWFCTMKAAQRVWPDAPNHKNNTLRYWRGIIDPLGEPRASIDAHRALSDCIVTGALFIDLVNAAPWAQHLEWQKEPAQFKRRF